MTEQINSLPAADTLTLEDKAAVESAREAYEALTDAQKQYVTEETVTALEELENRIQELEDAEEPEQAYVTVAIEKFTIGQDYLVEPVLVEITEGESTAQILDRVLGENGLRYDNTGSVDSSFYLSWILDEAGSLTAEFPEVSLQHAEEQGDVYKRQVWCRGRFPYLPCREPAGFPPARKYPPHGCSQFLSARQIHPYFSHPHRSR